MPANVVNIVHVSRILIGMSDEAQALYRAIADIAKMQGGTDMVKCPRDVLIDEAGLTVSQYKQAANDLEAAGLLERKTNWSDPQCRHNNTFKLLFPANKTPMQNLVDKLKRFAETCAALKQELRDLKAARIARELKGNRMPKLYGRVASILTMFDVKSN